MLSNVVSDRSVFQEEVIKRLKSLHGELRENRNYDQDKSLLQAAKLLSVTDFEFLTVKQLDMLAEFVNVSLVRAVAAYNYYVDRYSNPAVYKPRYREVGKVAPVDNLKRVSGYAEEVKEASLRKRVKVNGWAEFISWGLDNALASSKNDSWHRYNSVDLVSVIRKARAAWKVTDPLQVSSKESKVMVEWVVSLSRWVDVLTAVEHIWREVTVITSKSPDLENFFEAAAARYPFSGDIVFDSSGSGVLSVSSVTGVTLDKYDFNDVDLDPLFRELVELFDRVKLLPLDAAGEHFVEELRSSYLPDTISAYELVLVAGDEVQAFEGKSMVIQQLGVVKSRLEDLRRSYAEAAMRALSSQGEFISEAVKL